jgi:hypothetical protein
MAQPNWMQRVYKLIPFAEMWRANAQYVLTLAETGLKQKTPLPEHNMAMDLLERVFKLKSNPGQTAAQSLTDIQHLKGVFGEMKALIQAITKGDQYLQESTDPAHAGDIAYTFPGHWTKKDPNDGIWYVKAKIEPATDEFVIDASIHEFAHFCGPIGTGSIGHAKVAGLPAYGDLALGLSKVEAMVNASSYAWLAYLARKNPKEWLTAT